MCAQLFAPRLRVTIVRVRTLFDEYRARFCWRAAEWSLRKGRGLLAAAQFLEAAARACSDDDLLGNIRRAAGKGLLEAGLPGEAMRHLFAHAESRPDDTATVELLLRACESAEDAAAETKALRLLLARDPQRIAAHRRLAELLFETDSNAASSHLAVLAEAFPEDREVWRRLALSQSKRGDSAGEIAAWRRIAALEPGCHDTHRRLADLLWSRGEFAQALPHLEAAARSSDGTPAAWSRIAKARAMSGDRQGEAAALRKCFGRPAKAFPAHRRIAEIYLEQRAPHRALPHLRAALALRPKDRVLLTKLADACRALNRQGEEIAALSRLVDAGSREKPVVARLCSLLMADGRPGCVVRISCEAASRLQDAEISRFLAMALEETHAAPEKIIAAWRAVVAASCDDLAAHERLARLLTAQKRWCEAAPHFKRIAEAHPEDREIMIDMAATLDRIGEPAERITAWTDVLRLDAAYLPAHACLAELLEAEEPATAIAHLAILSAASPSDASLLRRLAEARRAAGDIFGEIAERQQLIELDAADLSQHRRLAEIFLSIKDAPNAARHLDLWEKQGGGDGAAWEKLARLQEAVGDRTGAVETWRRAASRGPLDAESCVAAARICILEGHPGESIGYFREALKTHPEDISLLRKLAKACRAGGRAEEEFGVLKEILEISPGDRRALRRIGDQLCADEKYAEAAPYLACALKAAPQSAKLARKYATAQRMAGDPAGEIEAWRHVQRLLPDDIDSHRRIGDILFGKKKYREAAPHLARVVEAEPANVRLCRRLVKTYRRAGDEAEETRALRRLIGMAPADNDSRLRIAALLHQQGEYREAVEHLEAIGAASHADPAALRLLAACCQLLDRRDEELACLSRLLQLDPESAPDHLRCGALLLEKMAFHEAETHLRIAAQAYPAESGILRSFAHCLAALGKRREEAKVLKRLVDVDADDFLSHRRLGELLSAEGAMKDAIGHLRRCLDKDDNDADTLRAFAEALSVLEPGGDETVAAWSRLLGTAPNDPRARRGLADAFFSAGRFAKADELYDLIAAEGPCDREFWRRRVAIAHVLDRPAQEFEILRQASVAHPDVADFAYALAGKMIEQKSHEAVDAMHAAWRRSPDPSLHATVARKLADTDQIDAAFAEFIFLTSEAPDAFSSWLELGEVASRMGRHRLAATYFSKAYQLSGENSHRKRWLGSLLEAGAFENVDANCAALAGKSLGDKNTRMQHARALAGLERFDDALRIAESCIEAGDSEGHDGFLHYLRVRVRMKAGSGGAAEAVSPGEQLFQRAEERQACGDLRGAAQIYRNGGAALRKYFTQKSADGEDVSGPDFLIIGAPRSGSSWLKHCLKRHPQLRVALGEPGYFNTNAHQSPATYAQQLAAIPRKPFGPGDASRRTIPKIVGEKTPEYLTIGDDAIELCAALYPQAKLICLIRDPVERAWSHLKHRRLAARSAEFYARAGEYQPEWLAKILEFGRYERHLRRWARRFPLDQFLLVDFERIRSDPHALLGEVQDFLGAERMDFSDMPLSSAKLTGATAAVQPSRQVADLLAGFYRGETFDVQELRSAMAGAVQERGPGSKAA